MTSINPEDPNNKPIKNPIILTDEQKAKILSIVNANPNNPPSLKDLTDVIFPGRNLDGRSFEGKAIKNYLATLSIKPRSTIDPKYSTGVELTEEHKLYIRNNALITSIQEMAQALFPDKKNISKISLEYKAIAELLSSENARVFNPESETATVPSTKRLIPKTLDQAARRVNDYVLNGIDIKNLKKDTKTQHYLQGLINYCHTPRYGLLLATLADGTDIELFESSFIRYVWNKPDLMEEEVDTYINLCCDIVNYTKMQREVDNLVELRDKCLDDSEGKRLSMAVVAQMGELYKEMDNNQKRQNAALKSLNGTRNDRLDGKRESASFLSSVEAWRDQARRERLVAIAERRKELIKKEVERLDTLDAFIGEIYGLNRESF